MRQLLEEIYASWYGELELGAPGTMKNLEELGQELARLIGKDKPWSKRQLYSVLKYDDYNISKKLVTALQTFAAVHFDGANSIVARLERKVVYSENGNLKSGSIVKGISVQCICGTWTVPRSWNGKYCSKDCRLEARRLRRKENKIA